MSLYWLFAFCIGSYVVGNISPAIILSKYVFKSDVRNEGSGNPGSTNMVRKFGVKVGILNLVLDMLKGVIPALVGLFAFGGIGYDFSPLGAVSNMNGQIAMYACGLSAVVGHCFPLLGVFNYFVSLIKREKPKAIGGKGVATTVGVIFVANPLIGLLGLAFGILYVVFFEYASIAALSIMTGFVLWEGFIREPSVTVTALIISFYFLVLYTHRMNIYRLLAGKENKASILKKKPKKV